MPTHNRVVMLKRAVDSVLKQSYANWELIIVDDGSSDTTPEYLSYISELDQRIKYFIHSKPQGACVARNLAINKAKGVFITGLDDDDEFLPDRLLTFLKCWDDKFSFISCNFFNDDGNGHQKRHFVRFGEFSLQNLLLNNEAGNQVFTLLSRLIEIGGFTHDIKKLQDWDCWIRLCGSYGEFKRLNNTSYIMHHGHEQPRVSSNQSYPEALIKLIENNKELYDERSKWLIIKYIVESNSTGFMYDMLRSRNFKEALFLLKKFISLKYIKA